MAMMKAKAIRGMRTRWEEEARKAASAQDVNVWLHYTTSINVLDIVLGDVEQLASRRVPFTPRQA